MKTLTLTLGSVALLALTGGLAEAGRGSSPAAIRSAIDSGSVDAIQSEFERAERLVCGVCVGMVTPLIDHEDSRVRQVAAWWLARRGVRRDIHNQMTARLGGADSVRARNAADVLGEFQRVEAIAPLGTALANTTLSTEARAAAARALGTIGDRAAEPALTRALGAAEPEVRASALGALRSLRGFDAAEVAAPMLLDAAEPVRIEAIHLLGATRSRAGVTNLVSVLQNDPSATVRKKAAWALGEVGASASEAGDALGKAASSDSSPLVRSLAAAALGRLTR